MNKYFKSNGKLLLTGEYLVLKGAKALALPVKLGQSMSVETVNQSSGIIYWNANEMNKPWFSAEIDKNDFKILSSDDKDKAERLRNILIAANSLNNNIFAEDTDYIINTNTDFNTQWGLGSSSTLINNISQWAEINPYELLRQTFKGSGYDIACANSSTPILYKTDGQNPVVQPSLFNPSFKDNLYFVYLGHKQNSSNEVKKFLDKNEDYANEVLSISEISEIFADIQTLRDFCYFIKLHEEILSKCLNQERIRKTFKDFEGEVKSLGAWGGDFIMIATEWNEEKVNSYFSNRGLNTVIKYKDLVI